MHSIILSIALLCLPVTASAHGDAPSFEKQVGPYLIDIGYDTIGFRPGEAVTFDFDLFRTDGPAPAFEPFQVVKVEISREGQILESEEIQNQRDFIPTMSYTFPEEGDYGLYIAYIQSGSIVAQAAFEAPVGEHNGTVGRTVNVVTYSAATLIILFAGYIAVSSFLRRKKA